VFDKVGIKQVIDWSGWIDAVGLLLSGMSANEIRKDLIEYMADRNRGGAPEKEVQKTTHSYWYPGSLFDPLPGLLIYG
jgi:hypothetical protein